MDKVKVDSNARIFGKALSDSCKDGKPVAMTVQIDWARAGEEHVSERQARTIAEFEKKVLALRAEFNMTDSLLRGLMHLSGYTRSADGLSWVPPVNQEARNARVENARLINSMKLEIETLEKFRTDWQTHAAERNHRMESIYNDLDWIAGQKMPLWLKRKIRKLQKNVRWSVPTP